jgi:adenine-specific DNA-methyltransferase
MGVRYIGSKARITDQIMKIAGKPTSQGAFVDVFCGTGSVAHAAADLGWSVKVNDFMESSVALATSGLTSIDQVPFAETGGYLETVKKLNDATPVFGFMYREYSPESKNVSGIERRYFTKENAAKIDGVRQLIAHWKSANYLNDLEHSLLLGDLILSTNSVANISGTYGCFLSEWTPSAERSILLAPRDVRVKKVDFEAIVGDAFEISTESNDVVYLDPPYTKRQYASYYHLLETLVVGDEPKVVGVCGLRPWQGKSSQFCYKTKALGAILRIVSQLQASRILLSYSDEGHVKQSELISGLKEIGELQMHPIEAIGRYRPNAKASSNRSQVNEYVIELLPARVRHLGH